MARTYKRKSNGQFAGGAGGSSGGGGGGGKKKKSKAKRAKISRQRNVKIVAGSLIGANVAAFATLGNPVAIYAGLAAGGAVGNKLGKKVDAQRASAKAGPKLKSGIKG